MRSVSLLGIIAGFLFASYPTYAQVADQTPSPQKEIDLPATYFNEIERSYSNVDQRLTRQTDKYLSRLYKDERRLKKKFSKIDSVSSERVFGNIDGLYAKMHGKLKDATDRVAGRSKGQYLPLLDSVKSSLSFLQKNGSPLTQDKLKGPLNQVNQLQSGLQQSEEVKSFISERKQQIKEALSNYAHLPKGITNSFADFNKQAYYYSAQIKEYRALLKDPGKAVEKGLSLLRQLPVFKTFMKQHSELASLFRLPEDPSDAQTSLAGLQTRTQVQQQIQTQLSAGGPNASQYVQQNMQGAQSQLNQLKDKVNKLGGSSGDMEMPDFKPNTQRTKTFWDRLEYGTNFQTAKNNFFPTTTDLGLSVGYRLNDKSTIGIGTSYKMGWGQNIRHISITHEGIGLRSYIDKKLKGSFYLSGGFEYNYQPLNDSLLTTLSHDRPSPWRQSGLIGISKIISVKSKFFRKTKLQLLYDFLSNQQVPRTQPVKFRVGYNF